MTSTVNVTSITSMSVTSSHMAGKFIESISSSSVFYAYNSSTGTMSFILYAYTDSFTKYARVNFVVGNNRKLYVYVADSGVGYTSGE